MLILLLMTVYFVVFSVRASLLPPQGAEGVSVPNSSEDPLYDQLSSVASAGYHPTHRLLVPGGMDICRLSEPRQEVGSHRCGLHARWAAVQHVSAGSLGLHDGCW